MLPPSTATINGLPMFTVYNRPTDYPAHVVVRMSMCAAGGSLSVGAEPELYDDIDEAREALADRGLYCVGRHPDDAPQIVEVWL